MPMLSTRRMEHGTTLLVDFDLGALMGAQEGFQKEDPEAIAQFIKILSGAGKARSVRRLSAVFRATEDQLREAEGEPSVLQALEEEAAARPYAESFKDAVGFFIEWGSSFKPVPSSSGGSTKAAKASSKGPRGSRSGGS
jgi:hypothetical protein